MRRLTPLQVRALSAVSWGSEHFGALVVGGEAPRRVVAALARRGLVKDVGAVAICDGDGVTIQPERYRTGFAITEAGALEIKRADKP